MKKQILFAGPKSRYTQYTERLARESSVRPEDYGIIAAVLTPRLNTRGGIFHVRYQGVSYKGETTITGLYVVRETPPLKVVFRKHRALRGDEVFGLLCFTGDTCNPGNVMSYAHIGQHGECTKDIGTYTDYATPKEYAALKKELERIYERDVVAVRKLMV